ncbi:hypothetical protein [Hyphococcus sp.]|uniref:hypothetical protein n=1 Tax=Hyphococcus sp. TaxID=2038636 RepID=UPI002088784D|nr:MAG: hypothetical protein DHS20C04_24110 [Marinicaulis sp.]
MILRRVIAHFKKQEWTAIGLDFVIVVVGVFIGIQVANWNDMQASKARETELLVELRRELEASIRVTNQKRDAFTQVVAAGRRSLKFIESDDDCGNECWPVLVDFFHASQWQTMDVNRSTYDEMRRQGLPRSRAIVDAVENYLAHNLNLASTHRLPVYRSLVRQMISVDAQAYYWENCFGLDDGVETYVLDCPKGVTDNVAARVVGKIVDHPGIEPNLTEWVGIMVSNPGDLGKQNETAKIAIAAIDAELERRK